MKAKLYINGIYWTTYNISELVPYLYIALYLFHDTKIFESKPVCDRIMLPVMKFVYKTRENKDTASYSLIRIDN